MISPAVALAPVIMAGVMAVPADHKPVAPSTKAAWCYAFHVAPKLWRPYGAYMRAWCR